MSTSYRTHVNDVLAKCGQTADLPNLSLDPDGVCGITLADGRDLSIVLDDKRGNLWALVGVIKLPEDLQLRAALYERMLIANVLCGGSNGGSLAVDPDADVALLQFSWRAETITRDSLLTGLSMAVARADATADTLLSA